MRTWEYKREFARFGPDSQDPETPFMAWLNAQGAEGWELISVSHSTDIEAGWKQTRTDVYGCLMKRRGGEAGMR